MFWLYDYLVVSFLWGIILVVCFFGGEFIRAVWFFLLVCFYGIVFFVVCVFWWFVFLVV